MAATTKDHILSAAADLYVQGRLVPGAERLSVVLDYMGVSASAGRSHFDGQQDFRDQLAEYLLTSLDRFKPFPDPDDLAKAWSSPTAEQVLLGIGDLYFTAYRRCTAFVVALRFYSLGRNRPGPTTQLLAAPYEQATIFHTERIQLLLDHLDLEMAPGLPIENLVDSIVASLEGHMLRDLVGLVAPAKDGHTLFAHTMLSLFDRYTRPAGVSRSAQFAHAGSARRRRRR